MIVKIGDAFLDLDKVTITLLEPASVTVYVQGKQHPLTLRASAEELATVRRVLGLQAQMTLDNARLMEEALDTWREDAPEEGDNAP